MAQHSLSLASQRQALNTQSHVWVSASAGTGKTKILTDRILLLLLENIDPGHILGITFTKAAAAEMLHRLTERLGLWATMDEEFVVKDLTSLFGSQPSEVQLERARRLFCKIIDGTDSLKIQTLHSFCQALLKRFPLEAAITPHFKVIDEAESHGLIEKSFEDIVGEGNKNKKDFDVLALSFSFDKLKDFLTSIALEKNVHSYGEKTLKEYLDIKDLLPWYTEIPGEELKNAAEIMINGGVEDQKRALLLKEILHSENLYQRRRDYFQIFLNQQGQQRARLLSKKITENYPGIRDLFEAEAQRISLYEQMRKAETIKNISSALMKIGSSLREKYTSLKQQSAALDYNDLISHTLRLLQCQDMRDWILYKLDAEIDHILVDEAQDTNVEQWAIVEALVEEFFAGKGAREVNRTLFAVGDEKQSIFSFQGADPDIFQKVRDSFSEKSNRIKKTWSDVTLQHSFRSSPVVLKAVNATFQNLFNVPFHESTREEQGGLVEIWPLLKPTAEMLEGGNSTSHSLAKQIAKKISTWLKNGERLPAKGRAIEPRDIMILVQRRSSFLYQVIRALKSHKIPVAGADRLQLLENIAVQDLLALCEFLLLPEDDFHLACVLKSPLFGLNEEQIFELCFDRGKESLWQRLKQHPKFSFESTILRELLKSVDFMGPYSLLSKILNEFEGWKKFQGRLGLEVRDVIEELLSLAINFEEREVFSLQKFVYWMKGQKIDVKRDFMGHSRNEVRVMTIHGAKGLQSPIVFLPDTTRVPQVREDWLPSSVGWIWNPRMDEDIEQTSVLRQALQKKKIEEYYRLLYVAMTRAEDRLYICGYEGQRSSAEGNWYEVMTNALVPLAHSFDLSEGTVLQIRESQKVTPLFEEKSLGVARKSEPEPAWLFIKPTVEQGTLPPKRPSAALDSQEATQFALKDHRYKRGLLIHKLLEVLPSIPEQDWSETARLLIVDFDMKDQWQELYSKVHGILKDPKFSHLFQANGYGEVPLTGKVEGEIVNAQIDRLIIENERVLIVDFKSDQNSACHQRKEVPREYVAQLELYKKLVRGLYPNKSVEAYILWTETATLTVV